MISSAKSIASPCTAPARSSGRRVRVRRADAERARRLAPARAIPAVEAVAGAAARVLPRRRASIAPRRSRSAGTLMKTLVLANQKGGVGKSRRRHPAGPLPRAARAARAGDRPRPPGQLQQAAARCPAAPRRPAFTADALLTAAAPALPGAAVRAGARRPGAADAGAAAATAHAVRAATCAPSSRGRWTQFDVCVIDTNPNPDIRVIAALASADFVLSPIQLNQEAMDGVSGAAQPRARRPAQDQGGAEPEAAADRPAADDGRAHAVPEGELRAGGAAVPPADDPHRRRAGRLRIDPAPLVPSPRPRPTARCCGR